MKDNRYPPNWSQIALQKKQSVNWVCERCGVQCLKPGEGKGLLKEERYRLRMAVHHCDYDPSNNSPSNLMALCSPCHLYYHRRQQGNMTPGQLSFFIKVWHGKILTKAPVPLRAGMCRVS